LLSENDIFVIFGCGGEREKWRGEEERDPKAAEKSLGTW
jgi:hypothetical protein